MHSSTGSFVLAALECVLSLLALGCIFGRRKGHEYRYLAVLLGSRSLFSVFLLAMMLMAGSSIERHQAYRLYFYGYWTSFAIEGVLGLFLINSLFNLAMAPLDGIKQLGVLVFRWAACISVAFTFATVLIPHLSQMLFITGFVTELQRMQGILTLCLLIFVCFAIRPLGLTYTSRIFGVSLGLGILATTNLLQSSWLAHFQRMYTMINAFSGSATCAALLLWTVYFALPEPKRRMIVLPTTSPFLRWNQIALVLGDAPGFVAIAGVPPELFAPAELEVMSRASKAMHARPLAGVEHTQTA